VLKFTLVPESFFDKEHARQILADAALLEEDAVVEYKELPQYKAVLIYSGDGERAMSLCRMLDVSYNLPDYNKVVVNFSSQIADIVIAQGKKLLLCNSFLATDNVTAQYFIFAALKQFQLNPEVTVLHFMEGTPISLQNDLFRFFKSVETL